MADTLRELADKLDAIALHIERGDYRWRPTCMRLREIAEKVRELERRGYVPDEAQAPYIAGPVREKSGEQMDD